MKHVLLAASLALSAASGLAIAQTSGGPVTSGTGSPVLSGTWAATANRSTGTGLRMPYERQFWNYAGIAGGRSDFQDACIGSCDRHDNAWKIYGGGKFNEVFGFEAGWLDLGRSNMGGGSVEARGLNLSLLAGFPIGSNSGVHAKVGTTYGTVESNGVAGLNNGRDHDWGLSYGVGATFGITQNLQARLDWDRHRFDFNGGKRDIDALMVGLQLKF